LPSIGKDANVKAFEDIKQRQLNSQYTSGKEVNKEYYEEYCKIYIANTILLDKVKEVVEQKEELISKIKKLQVFSSDLDLG